MNLVVIKEEQGRIMDLTYLKTEHLGATEVERKAIFDKLFETAEIAKFTQDQVRSYEESLKYYRDLKNSLDTAREEGKIEGKVEGKKEGKIEVATKALKNGLSIKAIIELTGLSGGEIKRIKTRNVS
jgi:predicted transposase/invertase (TIGR01784 family)